MTRRTTSLTSAPLLLTALAPMSATAADGLADGLADAISYAPADTSYLAFTDWRS
jgi:hypothetical protein